MSTILKVNPKVTRLVNYIKDIEDGKLQIPLFQRDFVWGRKQKLELFESLKLGYPIGSLLFWKPQESFKIKPDIGPFRTRERDINSSDFFYILDGFQRLSTLLGCLINPAKTPLEINDEDLIKEFTIFYDLENEEFTFSRSTPSDITLIPVNTLIDTYAFLDYVERLRNSVGDEAKSTLLIDKARKLSSDILDYQLPSIEIVGGSIEDAVDIFSRINSKGSKISSDWMVSALTYNEELDFRLGTEIDELIIRLKEYNFDKIKRDTILQCIQSSFGRISFDEKLSDLVKKPNFIEVTKKTIENIVKAVKFLFEDLLVIDIKLLPYNSQLIFITYFFNQVELPTDKMLNELKRWFWVTTYSNYFTIYSLSKQRLAFNQFSLFVLGFDDPIYNDKPNIPFQAAPFPKNIFFGSVRAKALVLFLLNKSNNFIAVSSDEVDELKIQYLFNEMQSPEGVVPVITYVPAQGASNIMQSKHSDMSFLFSNPDFEGFEKTFFLTENMRSYYADADWESVLLERKNLIKDAEQKFVASLGIIYEN